MRKENLTPGLFNGAVRRSIYIAPSGKMTSEYVVNCTACRRKR
jgi:hypothetical protein